MPSNDFTPDELVTKHGKTYPVVGGRLRLAHLEGLLGVATKIIDHHEDGAVVTATIQTKNGSFEAHGTASKARDGARMAHTLIELAETRAVARALRYGGFGVEFTGSEEVSHVNEAPPPAPSDPATPEQLALLRRLAGDLKALSGEPVNVPPPSTKADASREIDALKDAIATWRA